MTAHPVYDKTSSISQGHYVRLSQPADAAEIVDLLNCVYGGWGDLDTWRWKYMRSQADYCPPSTVAEVDGRIVGHFGILPMDAVWRGESIRAAQPVDAAVLPRYRRRGIMSSVAHMALDRAAESGASLIYAFPGLYSLSVNQSIGYQVVGFIPKLVRLLQPVRAAIRGVEMLPGDLQSLYRLRVGGGLGC